MGIQAENSKSRVHLLWVSAGAGAGAELALSCTLDSSRTAAVAIPSPALTSHLMMALLDVRQLVGAEARDNCMHTCESEKCRRGREDRAKSGVGHRGGIGTDNCCTLGDMKSPPTKFDRMTLCTWYTNADLL